MITGEPIGDRKVMINIKWFGKPRRTNKPDRKVLIRTVGARHRFLAGNSLTGKRKHWPKISETFPITFTEVYDSPVSRFFDEWVKGLIVPQEETHG